MAELIETLPLELVRNVERSLGDAGRAWLNELPELVDECAGRWSISVGPTFPDASFSYVAPAIRADGTECVLKLAVPEPEVAAEREVLRYWNGAAAVRFLEADTALCALLLERLQPGTNLATLAMADDDEATKIAAALMHRLWRPPPAEHAFIALATWFRSLLGVRESTRSAGPFPGPLLERAEQLTRELLDSSEAATLLHGDLHHFNILRSDLRGWVAIDPKGLVGDAAFDVAAFLRNPHPVPQSMLRRRLDILAVELTLDRQRIVDWCFVEAALNACWSLEDGDGKFAEKLAWAEMVLAL